jgi:hypothetical protein
MHTPAGIASFEVGAKRSVTLRISMQHVESGIHNIFIASAVYPSPGTLGAYRLIEALREVQIVKYDVEVLVNTWLVSMHNFLS